MTEIINCTIIGYEAGEAIELVINAADFETAFAEVFEVKPETLKPECNLPPVTAEQGAAAFDAIKAMCGG